jgi:hypothetical protein
MNNRMGFADRATAEVGTAASEGLTLRGRFEIELRDEQGEMLHHEVIEPNIVVDTGIDYIFQNDFEAATQYVGLLAATPSPVAGSTMTITKAESNLSNATRPQWVKAYAAKTLSNTATKAAFTFNGTDTIGGALIATDSTKAGTTGTLVAAKAFAGNLVVANGYTLTVQYDISGSSS